MVVVVQELVVAVVALPVVPRRAANKTAKASGTEEDVWEAPAEGEEVKVVVTEEPGRTREMAVQDLPLTFAINPLVTLIVLDLLDLVPQPEVQLMVMLILTMLNLARAVVVRVVVEPEAATGR